MRKLCANWMWPALVWMMLSASALAAEGGDRIILVADSRRASGLEAWWMNIYNESHVYFAALTVIVIPALGLIMARVTDFVMTRIGINLKSRVLAEH